MSEKKSFFAEKTGNVAKIRRQNILFLIKDSPSISASDIGLILNVSARTIERDFDWLKENGIVGKEGSDKR